jgi:hypothetical protein
LLAFARPGGLLRERLRAGARGGLAQRLGDHAVGQRHDHVVVLARPRELVLLLEQEPWLLALAALGDLDEFPEAFELLAVHAKHQLAGREPRARVAHGLPRAVVPHDHGAGTVLLRRDGAFEGAVRDRMVFDMDRHALVPGVEAGAFRHGPREHHAVELQAKVVVQARGRVLLDDERKRAGVGFAAFGRLARHGEVALRPIPRERVALGHGCVRYFCRAGNPRTASAELPAALVAARGPAGVQPVRRGMGLRSRPVCIALSGMGCPRKRPTLPPLARHCCRPWPLLGFSKE